MQQHNCNSHHPSISSGLLPLKHTVHYLFSGLQYRNFQKLRHYIEDSNSQINFWERKCSRSRTKNWMKLSSLFGFVFGSPVCSKWKIYILKCLQIIYPVRCRNHRCKNFQDGQLGYDVVNKHSSFPAM